MSRTGVFLETGEAAAARVTRNARRADLDGLRAVAIALVVVYHVWIGRVSGGVDVFLFLSAFLLTGSFLRRMEDDGRLRIGTYWIRRFSTLVPAAAATLLGVVAVAALLYPPERWRAVWDQTLGSLFYVQNRVLADTAVDYYARTDQTSPLQHFWSLSVQGQVFVLWPLLLLGALLLSRRTRLSAAAATTVVFAGVFAVSFTYSIALTAHAQQVAYFSTPARLWEFALGSLLAVLVSRVTLPGRWGSLAVWAGLIGIVTCGLVLDVEGAFPGWAALWPTLSAALVVVGGQANGGSAPARFLAAAPLQWLATVSYAFYLVHWPVLITWTVLTDRQRPDVLEGAVLIGISLLLAWGLTRLVTEPLEARLRQRGLAGRAVAIGVAVALVFAPVSTWRHLEVSSSGELGPEHPGAAAVLTGEISRTFDADPRPEPAEVAWPWFEPGEDCLDRYPGDQETCFHLAGETDDAFRIAVVGNSHSQQWGGMLEPLVRERGWDLTVFAAGGCPLGLDDDGTREPGACAGWREDVLDALEMLDPDLVVTVGSISMPSTTEENVSPGLDRAIQRIQDAVGAQVLVVRDNPRFDFDMWECGQDADDAGACDVELAAVQADRNPLADFDAWDGVSAVDLTPLVCPEGVCRPLVGNIHVYFDDNHLTTDYTRSMAWAIAEMIPA